MQVWLPSQAQSSTVPAWLWWICSFSAQLLKPAIKVLELTVSQLEWLKPTLVQSKKQWVVTLTTSNFWRSVLRQSHCFRKITTPRMSAMLFAGSLPMKLASLRGKYLMSMEDRVLLLTGITHRWKKSFSRQTKDGTYLEVQRNDSNF